MNKHHETHSPGSLANMLWLLTGRTPGRALYVGVESDTMFTALRGRAQEPLCVAPGQLGGVARGAGFDLVVCGAAGEVHGARDPVIEQAAHARKLLRDGGSYIALEPNPFWFRKGAGFTGARRRASAARLVAECRGEGYREAAAYYCDPGAADVTAMIPASQRAIELHQHIGASNSRLRMLVKLALLRTGFADAIYPARVLFASA